MDRQGATMRVLLVQAPRPRAGTGGHVSPLGLAAQNAALTPHHQRSILRAAERAAKAAVAAEGPC